MCLPVAELTFLKLNPSKSTIKITLLLLVSPHWRILLLITYVINEFWKTLFLRSRLNLSVQMMSKLDDKNYNKYTDNYSYCTLKTTKGHAKAVRLYLARRVCHCPTSILGNIHQILVSIPLRLCRSWLLWMQLATIFWNNIDLRLVVMLDMFSCNCLCCSV